MIIRASKMPLFLTCPQSLKRAPEIPIDSDSEIARLGTAVHEAMANYVMNNRVDAGELAEKHGVDLKELSILFAFGRQAWEELSPYFPTPEVEESMEATLNKVFCLRGRADVFQLATDAIHIIDWKSGYKKTNYWPQLLAYGYLAARQYGVPKAIVTLVWLRDRTMITKDITGA